MELLNGEIFGAVQSLSELFKLELPVKTSLNLAQLMVKLDVQYQSIEKVRIGLVNKHGTPGRDGQTKILPEDESFPKFIEEYNELMTQSIEVVITKVQLPQEVKGEPLLIKPSVMIPLGKFIDIDPGLKSVK